MQTSDEAALLAPFKHIADVPGKGFRSKMIDAFNLWLKVDTAVVEGVKDIVNKLHTSSLVIDDIEDNSKLRRGVPAAHCIYGLAASINSANYVYFLALQNAIDLVPEGEDKKATTVLRAFTEEMMNLHRGQGKDIYFRDAGVVPTQEQYLELVRNKTGGLFRLTVKLMQVFSDYNGDVFPLLDKMGEYFQVLDDYLNLQSANYHKSKTFCEDITEGKYSFVVIHSLHEFKKTGDERLHKILRQGTELDELKTYALELMSSTNSFEYTMQYLDNLYSDMCTKIQSLGGNRALIALLERLHSQTRQSTPEFSFA